MRYWPIVLLTALAACGSSEPEAAPQAAADSAAPTSRFEAGMHTARTAEAEIQAAQAQAQARLDSQMQAVSDPPAP